MKRIRNLLVFTALLISLNHAEYIRAQDLEVVFKNSLWGAGIGALVAVTSWALAENQESDELRKNLIQFSAVGMIGGMGYGFFRINQGGGISGMPRVARYYRRMAAKVVCVSIAKFAGHNPGA